MAGSGGGGGGSSSGHHQHHHHVRGTPYHVRPSPLRLALVVAAVFLAFPALSAPLFRCVCACFGGAGRERVLGF